MASYSQYLNQEQEEKRCCENVVVTPDKATFAADESTGSMETRLASIGRENTEDNRRKYRQLLFTAGADLNKYISGVMMFHETFYQKTDDGTPFAQQLDQKIVPRVEAEKDLIPLAATIDEGVTMGLLDDLNAAQHKKAEHKMNQNLSYSYSSDPRSGGNAQGQQIQGLSFHPSSYQTSTYTTSSTAPFHSSSSAAFIPNNLTLQQSQTRRMGADDKNLVNMLDAYFVDNTAPSTSGGSWTSQTVQVVESVQVPQLQQPLNSYSQQGLVPQIKGVNVKISTSPDKAEKERLKKARQAEAARMRYHRLTPEEKRELNLKRTLAQKRKRQREKEMEELESILRETNDIQEDPDITEQLREKRMRAKWAEAARTRYARMTPEERRAHNNRRRMRQMQNALAAIKEERRAQATHEFDAAGATTGDTSKDEEAVRQHIKAQNAKKAEAARQRYHRMTEDEKRIYNQRRTEAFRRRRMEEEMLLAMPIGRINGEALDRAQQIVVRNAKRAEAARLRYQRMTPDQRKLQSYNQKRYTPKRRRGDGGVDMGNNGMSSGASSAASGPSSAKKEDLDALSTLERDVIKRTQQAQQAILRQQRAAVQDVTRAASPNGTSYLLQQTGSNGHLGSQLQLSSNGIGHQQVVHAVHQLPVQSQLNVSHQNTLPQQLYSSGGMMISGQHSQSQQILNPYGQSGRV